MTRVVVENRTKILKIVVGTPISTVVAAAAAGVDVDNIAGITTTGAEHGDILIYNAVTETWTANNLINENQIIDGKHYPSDSAHAFMLLRRSDTSGAPPHLRQGETAYSYLVDSAHDGFGNGGQRLYIGVGTDSTYPDGSVRAQSLEVIGGSYFTNLLNHPAGVNTANSALIVDSNGHLDSLLVRQLTAINFTGTGVTNLDSTNVGNLNVANDAVFDSDVRIKGNLIVDGDTTFVLDIVLDSTDVIGDFNVYEGVANFNVDKQFFIDSVQIEQFIDSSVNDLLTSGNAVSLTYSNPNNSLNNSLTIAVDITDSANLGVASFDAVAGETESTTKQFSNVNGAVSITTLDGGFFGNDSRYPG